MTVIDKAAEVAAPPESGFVRTSRILAEKTETRTKKRTRLDRSVALLDKAHAEEKDATAAYAGLALQRADGADVSAASARRRVADATAERKACEDAVAIAKADREAANLEFLQARVDHGRHDEARLRLIIVDRTRNLAKAGRGFNLAVVDVQAAVSTLEEAQRDNRSELWKLNPAMANTARYFADEKLQRVDRLCGALGGKTINAIIENRPHGCDFDEIASREEALAARETR
jgi:hypothetical protein